MTQVPGVDRGKGFVQEADLIVTEGKVAGNFPPLPGDISDGSVVLNMQRMDNIIAIPFDAIGEFSIEIVFVSGDKVQIRGTGAKLVLHGEPTSKSFLVDSVKHESTSHDNGLIEVELRGLNEGFNLD